MPDLTGQQLNQYRIVKQLGHGTVGTVYLAEDSGVTSRVVVIKVIHPHIASNEGFRARLLRAIPALTALQHPNVIRVYRAEVTDKLTYLVMDYLPGGSLQDYFRHYVKAQELPPLGEVIEYCAQVADGLHYAHDQGVIHYDVRPDNVLFRPEPKGSHHPYQMVVTDFAIKQLTRGGTSSEVVQHEDLLPYMSPEVALGQPAEPRSDLYSLGIILYRFSVGRLPFDPKDAGEAYRMHVGQPVPPPRSIRPKLPEALQQIILRCLKKDPNERYQEAAELARDLRRVKIELEHQYLTNIGQHPDSMRTFPAVETIAAQPYPHTQPEIPPDQAGRDRVVIAGNNQPTRAVILERDVTIIGRDATADISLEHNQISRYHARIEKLPDGRYQVVDLGSTNGSWLGASKLTPNQSVIWGLGEPLRVGGFQLYLEPGNLPQRNLTVPRPHVRETIPGAIPQQEKLPSAVVQAAQLYPLDVEGTLEPRRIIVQPGATQSARLVIRNLDDQVAHYVMSVRGLPSESWVTVPDVTVRMGQNEETVLNVAFHPPRDPNYAAGLYPFEILLSNPEQPNGIPKSVYGELQLEPFYGFTSDLTPNRLRGRGTVVLKINNAGNTPMNFHVRARDREDALNIGIAQVSMTIRPGSMQEVAVPIAPRSRHLFGSQERYAFEVSVDDEREDTDPQVHNGEITVTPWFKPWMLSLLFVFGLTGTGIFFCAINQLASIGRSNEEGTRVASTAAAQINMTATAQSDEDQDGLLLFEEIRLGTNPRDSDTDDDGLTDWVEVKQYGTNPIARDSDGDGLTDGEEVNQGCTSPTNPDTDGDGANDKADPSPCTPGVDLPTAVPPTPPPVVTDPGPDVSAPEQAVRAYFDALRARQYDQAWAQLSFNYQLSRYNGSRTEFENFWNQVISISLGNVILQFRDENAAAVTIEAAYEREGQPVELDPAPYVALTRDPLTKAWLIDDKRAGP